MDLPTFWKNYVEYPLWKMGLYENKLKRFAFFTAATMILLRITKPKGLFNEDGEPREVSFDNPLNWITASTIPGILSVLLV